MAGSRKLHCACRNLKLNAFLCHRSCRLSGVHVKAQIVHENGEKIKDEVLTAVMVMRSFLTGG